MTDAAASDRRKCVVFLSAYHDFRTRKRASIQQVAEGARALGHEIWFVSTRYSRLSRRTGDSRLFLDDRSNRVEEVDGVHCYLWKTPVHPFASRNALLDSAMAGLFTPYANWPDRTFDTIMARADHIVIESSIAAIYLARIRRLNPGARIIYYATDLLDTVGAHRAVQQRLVRDGGLIDHVALRSSKMVAAFDWAKGRLHRAEFGVDPAALETVGASPYDPGQHAVSVGSMLFDPGFFQLAAPRFPDITFHVIGCGTSFEAPANVRIYPEMPFRDTLPYVKHAAIGVAPYRPAPGVEYIAESSLKLAQYEMFGVPAICPDFAVGEAGLRSGYVPGDGDSIERAVLRALSLVGKVPHRSIPSWQQVAERVLDPERFPETRLG